MAQKRRSIMVRVTPEQYEQFVRWQTYLAALPACPALANGHGLNACDAADDAIAAFQAHLDDEQARAPALGAAEQFDAGSGDAEREAGEAAGGGHG